MQMDPCSVPSEHIWEHLSVHARGMGKGFTVWRSGFAILNQGYTNRSCPFRNIETLNHLGLFVTKEAQCILFWCGTGYSRYSRTANIVQVIIEWRQIGQKPHIIEGH